VTPDQTPYYGPMNAPAPHGVELNLITRSMFTRVVRNMRFYDAMTSIFLAAEIHGTDQAVLRSMWKVLPRVQPDKQPLILSMMTAISPLEHVQKLLTTLPPSFLEAEISKLRLEELQSVVGIPPEAPQSLQIDEAA